MKCTQNFKDVPNPLVCHPFGYGDLTSDSLRVQSQAKTTQEIHKGNGKLTSFDPCFASVLDQISHIHGHLVNLR